MPCRRISAEMTLRLAPSAQTAIERVEDAREKYLPPILAREESSGRARTCAGFRKKRELSEHEANVYERDAITRFYGGIAYPRGITVSGAGNNLPAPVY